MKIMVGVVFALGLIACGSTEKTQAIAKQSEPLPSSPNEPLSEATLPAHWQEHWLQEPIFGAKVHLVETGNKNAPTLILVHGLGFNGLLDWLDVIPKLEQDYHVVALDLPGFGDSSSTNQQLDPQQYSLLLNWLVPQFSDDKVTVIGHSMGGAVSLRYAADFPQQVEKLIMIDTAGVLQRSVFVLHMTQVPDSYAWLDPYTAKYSKLDKMVGKITNIVNGLRTSIIAKLDRYPDPAQILMDNEFAKRYMYKDRATLNAALGLIYEDLTPSIEKLSVPTHIIWGRKDRVAPLRTGKLLAGKLADSQLHIIEDAGHVPMRDKPEQFMRNLAFSLNHSPQPSVQPIVEKTLPLKNFSCNRQHDLEVSGHYNNITLQDCNRINLTNVQASTITINNSNVDIENSRFLAIQTAMHVKESNVTMTNVDLTGSIAMSVNGSLVDAAGVNFEGDTTAIVIEGDSNLYYSVCSETKNGTRQILHGMSFSSQE